jgi:hypothetical protein
VSHFLKKPKVISKLYSIIAECTPNELGETLSALLEAVKLEDSLSLSPSSSSSCPSSGHAQTQAVFIGMLLLVIYPRTFTHTSHDDRLFTQTFTMAVFTGNGRCVSVYSCPLNSVSGGQIGVIIGVIHANSNLHNLYPSELQEKVLNLN